ncbi:MAG TPA: hypothetical protein VN944_04360 [Nitrospiria bacterium]|nr:hypothetical protein [Nitrospiria bacterium]
MFLNEDDHKKIESDNPRLSVLVRLENGTIIRIKETGGSKLTLTVSQGFYHQKAYKNLSSYANLIFHPEVPETGADACIVIMARFLVSFTGVAECLISGGGGDRRSLRNLLGNDTERTGKNIVWGSASVLPLDLSSYISATPRKGILTLSEAIFPLESLRNRAIRHQLLKTFRDK